MSIAEALRLRRNPIGHWKYKRDQWGKDTGGRRWRWRLRNMEPHRLSMNHTLFEHKN